METNLPEIAGAKQISRRAVERRNGLSKESAADVYSWVDATRFKVHLAEFKRPNSARGRRFKENPALIRFNVVPPRRSVFSEKYDRKVLIGGCCVDRLSRQRLPEKWSTSRGVTSLDWWTGSPPRDPYCAFWERRENALNRD